MGETLDVWAEAARPKDKKAEGKVVKSKALVKESGVDAPGAGAPATELENMEEAEHSLDEWFRLLQAQQLDVRSCAIVCRAALADGGQLGALLVGAHTSAILNASLTS